MRQRLAVQAKLRAERAALRQQRLVRLGRAMPVAQEAASAPAAPEAPPAVQVAVDGPQAEAAVPSPAAPVAPPSGPPLAAIGFGPGMIIRFGQLGIETAADLAASDPDALRTALGDITRLINVEMWIEAAKRACSGAVTGEGKDVLF